MIHLCQRSSNQPIASHTHVDSTSYTVPLDHFTGMTNNVVTVLDQLLVGSHTILPLQLASSTMVPQATHVSVESVVITQAPIGTPLQPIPNPSLPPGYHFHSRGANLFVPPGYNAASSFVPTPTQVLSRRPSIPPPPSPGGSNRPVPSSSNQIGGTSHYVTSVFQIPVGGKPQVGDHNPVYGQYTPGLQSQLWNFLFQGNQKLPGGKHPQVNSFVSPNLGHPYLGSMNPTWGQGFHSNAPSQGSLPNQPTQVGYLTQNPPPSNLTGPYNYIYTSYGPTSIPTGLPPQNYQFPQVKRQLSFLATLDL
jgi:hypothetical protein